MKKTLNHIFDEANAGEIENLVKQNAAPEVSADTLSAIKDKVYAKTNLKKEKKPPIRIWLRFGAIAACFALILSAVIVVPMLREDDPVVPPDNGSVGNDGDSAIVTPNNGTGNEGEGEFQLESYYDFEINSDTFTPYIRGKVIGVEKVGSKLESVTVTGGWKNAAGKWISTEALNAELYEITGVDSGIAVALKFIDQGEGATTTHYYVMMNPNADLSAIEDYISAPIVPNNPGDEMVGEVNE